MCRQTDNWFDLVAGNMASFAEKRFGLYWSGKEQAGLEAQKPGRATLRPCPDVSVNWETTQNLYIEGDNLEALKLLQKSHNNRIKMIYIDPLYNTEKGSCLRIISTRIRQTIPRQKEKKQLV